MLTLRQEDSQEEEEEVVEEVVEEDERRPQLGAVEAPPSGELALLLAQSDILHTGDATLKAEGFRLLQDNRAEVRAECVRVLYVRVCECVCVRAVRASQDTVVCITLGTLRRQNLADFLALSAVYFCIAL